MSSILDWLPLLNTFKVIHPQNVLPGGYYSISEDGKLAVPQVREQLANQMSLIKVFQGTSEYRRPKRTEQNSYPNSHSLDNKSQKPFLCCFLQL